MPADLRLADAPSSEGEACRHCGAAVVKGAPAGYCCAGCAAAHTLIEGYGLSAFYERMAVKSGLRRLRPEDQPGQDLALNVVTNHAGESTLHLMVDGLHCAACVWLIEMVLSRQPDVVAGRVNFTTRRLRLVWRGGAERANDLVGLLTRLGFRLVPYDPAKLAVAADATLRQLTQCLAVAGFAAGNVMLLSVSVWAGHGGSMGQATRDLLHWISALIAMPAILFAGQPFFRSAEAALARGRTNMDVPISIGVLLATAMSLSETIRHGPYAYFDSALVLLFFLLIGRVLDHRARGQTRAAAAHLVSLGVTGVTRLDTSGLTTIVPCWSLTAGDRKSTRLNSSH